jgi:hypothetical protein
MRVVMDFRLVPKICVILLFTFGIILILQGLSLLRHKRKIRFGKAAELYASKENIFVIDKNKWDCRLC